MSDEIRNAAEAVAATGYIRDVVRPDDTADAIDRILREYLGQMAREAAAFRWLEANAHSIEAKGYGADDMWWTLGYNDGNWKERSTLLGTVEDAMKGGE